MNDRLLIHVLRLDRAEFIRKSLMKLTPRPTVYVVFSSLNPSGYDIYIANEFGGYADDTLFDSCQNKLDELDAETESES